MRVAPVLLILCSIFAFGEQNLTKEFLSAPKKPEEKQEKPINILTPTTHDKVREFSECQNKNQDARVCQ